MKTKARRVFSADFKARIALEAARGARTINEIAAQHGIHPVQVSTWKRELLEGARSLFERAASGKRREQEEEKLRARLERKIGQLAVEVDWLEKKCKELGL